MDGWMDGIETISLRMIIIAAPFRSLSLSTPRLNLPTRLPQKLHNSNHRRDDQPQVRKGRRNPSTDTLSRVTRSVADGVEDTTEDPSCS